ncbi:MAG: hypothetical protein IT175_06740 [Acidobacteria bacterium]|nr:hypothetical protein [Acidobacteriota bacterium]
MTQQYIYNKRIRNSAIRRRLDRRFVSWVLICATIGTVIASGFVFSARCHFEAVALGYETQQKRVLIEEHEKDRRQLEMERSKALSPEELEQRARKLGLRAPEMRQPDPATGATSAVNRPSRPRT